MKLNLTWQPPIELSKSTDGGQIYECDLNALPEKPGVYIFGRRHGQKFEALYVGIATNSVRSRVRQQFNNLRLMSYVQNAATGSRLLHAGKFEARQGQQPRNCLRIVERSLIRHFLEEGHQLVNVHGTKIATHEISSDGSTMHVPKTIHVDAN